MLFPKSFQLGKFQTNKSERLYPGRQVWELAPSTFCSQRGEEHAFRATISTGSHRPASTCIGHPFPSAGGVAVCDLAQTYIHRILFIELVKVFNCVYYAPEY